MGQVSANAFLSRAGLSEEDFRFMSGLSLFANIDDEKLIPLLSDAASRHYERGQILFFQDEPADRFYFVLDGWVKIYRLSSEGEESIIHVFARGDSFAEAAIFEEGTFPVTAQAVEDTRVLSIPAQSFIERLKGDPSLCLNIMAAMSRHLRSLVSQLEQLTTKSSTQRLADLLVRMSGRDSGPTEIRLPLDKSLIAGRLGMQPETLSRSLSKLRSVGVATDRNRVAIDDIAALRAFASNASARN